MEITSTFINIRTDYGFKRIFGTPKNKKILIRFLNALLGDGVRILDVVYHDKEVLAADDDGKRIVYDIYCTSQNDEHHFILEMQNVYEPPFEERLLYYISKAISGQGSKGWDYTLQPVISVAITNFDFRHISKKLIHDMRMADVSTGDILTDKIRILLCSLKQIEKRTWRECTTEIERMLYLIKNMEKMDKNSEIYRSKEYEDLFDAAEASSLANEDVVAYSNSLQKLRASEAGIEYARRESYSEGESHGFERGLEQGVKQGLEQGVKQGIEQGVKQGIMEGLEQERRIIALNMIAMGVSDEIIKASTKLTDSEINSLKEAN